LQYAEEIFSLGNELQDALRGGRDGAPTPLVRIGIADSVPKAIAYHVVEPALRITPAPRLLCSEGKLPALLGELALRKLELVVSDVPLPGQLGVRAFSHLLGRSAIAFFGAPSMLQQYGWTLRRARSRFPAVLGEVPMLMPGAESALRPRLEAWLRRQGLALKVAAEFDDTALMKAFGREGSGVFAAPAVLADEITRQYQVARLGTAEDVAEEFYGISVERRISHPAIAAITASARQELFASGA
jgi:LysR family transcriptional activator of nhaA